MAYESGLRGIVEIDLDESSVEKEIKDLREELSTLEELDMDVDTSRVEKKFKSLKGAAREQFKATGEAPTEELGKLRQTVGRLPGDSGGGGGLLGGLAGGRMGKSGKLGGMLKGAGKAILPVALAGAIGLGILKSIEKLSKASPALAKVVDMFGMALKLFFRPFGDFLAQVLMPWAITALKMALKFNKIASEQGLIVAIGKMGTEVLKGIGKWVGEAVGKILPDGFDTGFGDISLGGQLGRIWEKIGKINWGEVLNPINWPDILKKLSKEDILDLVFVALTAAGIIAALFGNVVIGAALILTALFGDDVLVEAKQFLDKVIEGDITPAEILDFLFDTTIGNALLLSTLFGGVALTTVKVLEWVFDTDITGQKILEFVWGQIELNNQKLLDFVFGGGILEKRDIIQQVFGNARLVGRQVMKFVFEKLEGGAQTVLDFIFALARGEMDTEKILKFIFGLVSITTNVLLEFLFVQIKVAATILGFIFGAVEFTVGKIAEYLWGAVTFTAKKIMQFLWGTITWTAKKIMQFLWGGIRWTANKILQFLWGNLVWSVTKILNFLFGTNFRINSGQLLRHISWPRIRKRDILSALGLGGGGRNYNPGPRRSGGMQGGDSRLKREEEKQKGRTGGGRKSGGGGTRGGTGGSRNPFSPTASGGLVTSPTKIMAGEQEPEAILPLSDLYRLFGQRQNGAVDRRAVRGDVGANPRGSDVERLVDAMEGVLDELRNRDKTSVVIDGDEIGELLSERESKYILRREVTK